ncbi:MAG: WhiB family transcriptional regulator, partial [Frankiales bacterium]|nr:WhiB family transcriptional regulator [Frankiales bacterium]
HNALCRKAERPDVMYPDPTDQVRLRTAKQWCDRCPVTSRCADWALDNREQFGVWGGLSEAERRQMLRRRAEQKPKPEPEPEPEAVPAAAPAPLTIGVRCDVTELDSAMCAHCRTPPAKTEQGRVLAPCGTNAAYRRHVRHGEPADYACRLAHNAANQRLRDTGTTKVAA